MDVRAAVVASLVTASATFVHSASLTVLERQRLVAHLEMTGAWLADEVSQLTPAQLAFRRAPGEWSIAQVLDHLLVVAPIYWADLQGAVKAPADPGGSRTTDADMLWYGIDRTNREQAIPTEVPKGLVRDVQSALAEYRKHHARLLDYVRTTQDDLRAHYVPRQGCDAYQWALLITTHEQRHILQIREIKADKRFPAPPPR
jgi:DinB superfamily